MVYPEMWINSYASNDYPTGVPSSVPVNYYFGPPRYCFFRVISIFFTVFLRSSPFYFPTPFFGPLQPPANPSSSFFLPRLPFSRFRIIESSEVPSHSFPLLLDGPLLFIAVLRLSTSRLLCYGTPSSAMCF